MRYSLLILSLIMVSCARDDYDPRTNTAIEPTVIPYYKRFAADFGVSAFSIPVSIVPLPAPKLGMCTIYYGHSEDYREIRLNSDNWYTLPDADKEQLVYHELGHCLLNRGHDNSVLGTITFPWGTIPIAKTIMNEVHFASDLYLQYHKYYLLELKDPTMTIGRAYAP